MRRLTRRHFDSTGALLACLFVFGVASSFAQTLGEVARQERARKRGQPRRPTRVYTNEDLARPQILDPADRARAEAARRDSSPPPAVGAVEVPRVPGSLTELPLGDVARYYRLLKQIREFQAEVPSVPGSLTELPLGDIARYYRLLKQIRELQEVGEVETLPGATPLAWPSLSMPPVLSPAPSLTKPKLLRQSHPARIGEPQAAGGVRVRRGDSLWKLARRHLGRGTKWRQIASINPAIADPNRIRAGQWIRLPLKTGSSVAKQFSVHRGDTLWNLARAEFGNALAWSCIAQANPQLQDANLIYPGQILTLPARCPERP